MNWKIRFCILVLGTIILSAGAAASDDWVRLEADVAPKVEYRIDRKTIEVRAENPYGSVKGTLAVKFGDAKKFALTKFPARINYAKEMKGGKELKIALEMNWFRKDGTLRERRVYFCDPEGNKLPKYVSHLKPFDLAAHEKQIADRASGIFIPMDDVTRGKEGFYTAVIEDANGKRIRNLASSVPFKGTLENIEWDGRDEFGRSVPAGKYRIRGLAHDGIRQNYLMQLCNGDETFADIWGSNHSMMTALAVNKDYVFTASKLTEGGYAVVALTSEGKWVRGYEQANWRGVDRVAIAADDDKLYLVMQGCNYDNQPDKRPRLGLTVYNIADDKVQRFNNEKTRFIYTPEIDLDAFKKSLAEKTVRVKPNPSPKYLSGVALFDGKLHVAVREVNAILVVDSKTAEVVKQCPLADPAAPTLADGRLYVASGRDVCVFDEKSGTFAKAWSLPFEPTSMSFDGKRFAVLGCADSTVKFYDLSGRPCGSLGEPGGAYAGAWMPKRLVNPTEVQFAPDGTLWTTERRTNPKRVVRWSKTGDVLYEKYGCPSYGASSCGFDGDDATRFIASGVEWKIDYEKKTAKPVNVLWRDNLSCGIFDKPLQTQIASYCGKKYVVEMGHATRISEWKDDGSLKPVFIISNFRDFAKNSAKTCEPFVAFFEKNFPDYFKKNPRTTHGPLRGFVWHDANGNGEIDEEEFVLFPEGRTVISYWGITAMGVTIKIPFKDEGGVEKIVSFEPYGLTEKGAIKYDVARAFAEAKPAAFELPIGSKGMSGCVTANDLRGNVLLTGDPWMMHVSGDGKLNWFYQNKWNDVHGSHKAPFFERGVFQGTLFALGTAPFDKESDLMAIIGNYGVVHLMTTDGLYVSHIFNDARAYSSRDFNNNGGEPFGGTFTYDKKTGRYMVQCGKGGYRLFDVRGLDTVRRFSREITLSAEQIAAAQRRNPVKNDDDGKEKIAKIKHQKKIDFNRLRHLADWRQGALSCYVSGAFDDTYLGLRWHVEDPSAWKNGGKNFTSLFKTGDSVDLQLSLTREGAKRNDGIIAGDIRLLIAPCENENVMVLYRYKAKDGETGLNPVGFSSPWRTYTVADVKKLTHGGVIVQKIDNGYVATARITLSELGVTADDLMGAHLGDFGVIFGDKDGTVNTSRSYWSNKETGLVNDVPGEIIPQKKNWGRIVFEK